jgi:putative oxygen-independent coproporphyrinogen III oxidase
MVTVDRHIAPADGATDPAPGFGLYVHWPFCLSKCPYCDFNSHVASNGVDHERWARALLRELDHFAAETSGRKLGSIFFGGGTPSLMAPSTVAAVIERAATHFRLAEDVEITLEANPTSVEAQRLADFRAAGVNRVSLGVQALDDDALRALGREHGAREALDAVGLAARLFPRFSFDLIYARPGQTLADWDVELRRALDHADGHLSVYQLTIEPGTRFHTLHAQGILRLPPEELQTDLYELTQARLAAVGLPAYEISNHARPGEACRHNLVYWRGGDYVGIGAGAHGRLTTDDGRVATRTARMPRAWVDRVERHGHAEMAREALSPADQLVELLLMGLRLTEGVSLERLRRIGGETFESTLNMAAVRRLMAESFLEKSNDRLATTAAGRQRLNAVLEAVIRLPA